MCDPYFEAVRHFTSCYHLGISVLFSHCSIVSTPLTPWDRWNYRTQQRSPVLNLTAGEPLLLVADNTEAYGSDYLQVLGVSDIKSLLLCSCTYNSISLCKI